MKPRNQRKHERGRKLQEGSGKEAELIWACDVMRGEEEYVGRRDEQGKRRVSAKRRRLDSVRADL